MEAQDVFFGGVFIQISDDFIRRLISMRVDNDVLPDLEQMGASYANAVEVISRATLASYVSM